MPVSSIACVSARTLALIAGLTVSASLPLATARVALGQVASGPAIATLGAAPEVDQLQDDEALQPSIAPVVELELPIGASHLVFAPNNREIEAGHAVVHTQVFTAPGAPWVRLNLAGTVLTGEAGAEGARLRITSLQSGESQVLTSESLAHWGNTSAYFAGESVVVEVLMWGHSDEAWKTSHLRVPSMWYGQASSFAARSLCDGADDRVVSSDRRVGRTSGGCTGWLVNDANGSGFTAGHCGMTAASVVSFQVPLSSSTGAYAAAAVADQYPVDGVSVQGIGNGVGDDWRVYGHFVNSNTGLTARQSQGSTYILATTIPGITSGAQIRVTGYGTVSAPVSLTLNGVQKTHTGAYTSLSATTLRYRPDTTGGNSGSPVIHEPTGLAIGIHTHGGCGASGTGANNGTALTNPNFTTARNTPLGVAASGVANAASVASQPIVVLGDDANNLGRMHPSTGAYGRTATVGARWQSITWDPARSRAIAINEARQLHTIDLSSGVATLLGTVSGTTQVITGIAIDPLTDTLYGVTNATGQLLVINQSTFAATLRGPSTTNRYSALEFDLATGELFAIEINTTLGARLVRINQTAGTATVVGALGIAGAVVQGLAIDQATGGLLAVNSATDSTLTINRATGAATVLRAAAGGSFGARLGMTGMYETCLVDLDFNNDGLFPDDTDLVVLLATLSGASCAGCDSIDINRDGLFPDDTDLVAFLDALAGGC